MQNENAIILKKESTKSLELYHMFSKHGQQLTHVFKSRLGISSMAVNLLSMDPTNKTKQGLQLISTEKVSTIVSIDRWKMELSKQMYV